MYVAVEKPRIFQGAKDMVLSLAVIVILMVLVVIGTGLSSFNQHKKGQAVTVADPYSFIAVEARTASFPLRVPDVPSDWECSIARRIQIGDEFDPLLGWVTSDSHYVQLIQTTVDPDTAYSQVDDKNRSLTDIRSIDDLTVKIYTGDEPLWATTLADHVTLIITGLADDTQFEQLLSAAAHAQPVKADDFDSVTGLSGDGTESIDPSDSSYTPDPSDSSMTATAIPAKS